MVGYIIVIFRLESKARRSADRRRRSSPGLTSLANQSRSSPVLSSRVNQSRRRRSTTASSAGRSSSRPNLATHHSRQAAGPARWRALPRRSLSRDRTGRTSASLTRRTIVSSAAKRSNPRLVSLTEGVTAARPVWK